MADDVVQARRLPTFTETPEEVAFELRAHEGALWTGGKLLIGIWAFACAALAFAYFYLRSANNEDLWRPNGRDRPDRRGARRSSRSRLLERVPRRLRVPPVPPRPRARLDGRGLDRGARARCASSASRSGSSPSSRFFPGSSGYASCFIGWASLNIALVLSGDLLARDVARAGAAAAPGRQGGRRDVALGAAQRAHAAREPRGVHVLLGLHRARRDVLLGTLLRPVSERGGDDDELVRDPVPDPRHPARLLPRRAHPGGSSSAAPRGERAVAARPRSRGDRPRVWLAVPRRGLRRRRRWSRRSLARAHLRDRRTPSSSPSSRSRVPALVVLGAPWRRLGAARAARASARSAPRRSSTGLRRARRRGRRGRRLADAGCGERASTTTAGSSASRR